MSTDSPASEPHEIRAAARKAIDEEQLITVLENATEGDYDSDPQAAAALKEATAMEAERIARRAALRARLRNRGIEAEDVARTQEARERERRRRRNTSLRGGLIE